MALPAIRGNGRSASYPCQGYAGGLLCVSVGYDIFSTIPDMEVGIFVVDGVAEFGLSALLETFGTANAVRDTVPSPPPPWRIRIVSFGSSVRSSSGFTVPTVPLPDLPAPDGFAELDMMIVPAVRVFDAAPLIELVSAPESKPVLDGIRLAHRSGAHIAAACTGTFFLAEAGILDGLPATTSWWLGPTFRRRYPAIALDESRTLCRSARATTAGAALSHLDLALSLIQVDSPAVAELASRYLVVGDGRTQGNYIVTEVVAHGNSLTAAFERWVRAHLGEQFRIAAVAGELGVTERSLQRATQAELGISPRDFVNNIRLEHATHLLRTTPLTLEAIAAKVGYLNAGTLRGLVRKRRGMSIAELRTSSLTW